MTQANQIEKLLLELTELKEKLADTKAVLHHYKITSETLTQLKKTKKELGEQIDDEKKRIEDGYLGEKDYEEAYNDNLKIKSDIKEKNAHLKKAMSEINTSETLSTYTYNIKGEELKVQVERAVKVYINGKEEK